MTIFILLIKIDLFSNIPLQMLKCLRMNKQEMYMLEKLLRIRSRDSVGLYALMEYFMKDTGTITNITDKDSIWTLKEITFQDSLKIINQKGSAY